MKAVIFDMDGILIDSEPFWRTAQIEGFAEVGIHITEEDCQKHTGTRINEVVDRYYESQPWKGPSREDVTEDIIHRVETLVRGQGLPMPGAFEVIEFLKSRNFRLAVASSSSMRLIETTLDHLQIRNKFEIVHSAESELFGKPDPAVYLSTAKKLGVSPRNCLAIEDSVNGMNSALNAGMITLVVPAEHDRGRKEFDSAHLRLNTLAEFGEIHLAQAQNLSKKHANA